LSSNFPIVCNRSERKKGRKKERRRRYVVEGGKVRRKSGLFYSLWGRPHFGMGRKKGEKGKG